MALGVPVPARLASPCPQLRGMGSPQVLDTGRDQPVQGFAWIAVNLLETGQELRLARTGREPSSPSCSRSALRDPEQRGNAGVVAAQGFDELRVCLQLHCSESPNETRNELPVRAAPALEEKLVVAHLLGSFQRVRVCSSSPSPGGISHEARRGHRRQPRSGSLLGGGGFCGSLTVAPGIGLPVSRTSG